MIIVNAMISYPYIFEPKENLSGALKYSCSLLIDKKDVKTVNAIRTMIAKVTEKGKEEKWNNKLPKFRYAPLRDGDAELASGDKDDPSYKGKFFLNASSNDPIGVVDEHARPLMDQTKIYAGCIVNADVNPFAYKMKGNCGIGWGLNNIMFVKESGTRLDGKQNAESAFANFASVEVPEDGLE